MDDPVSILRQVVSGVFRVQVDVGLIDCACFDLGAVIVVIDMSEVETTNQRPLLLAWPLQSVFNFLDHLSY